MKVLFINTVYGRGSTGRIVADLGNMLEKNGHEFKVAFGRVTNKEDLHCYRVGNSMDTCVHATLARITDKAGFYSKRATRRLIEFIRQYSPDVIHLHNLHGYYINIEILFKYLADEYKGRVIWTLHDCWAFTGHCTFFSFANCDKWKSKCENCPQQHEYPNSIFFSNSEKNLIKKQELINKVPDIEFVTVSNWLKQLVKESILGGHNVTAIYNGIDCNKFRPLKVGKAKYGLQGYKVILCVSDCWDARKGIDKITELAGKVDAQTKLVVIGMNKKQIKNLPSNVIGMERTWDQNELIDYYNMADVFFNPSNEETFGLVTAEAMACGTPAVVYDTTACPEIVGSEKCGFILPKESDASEYLKSVAGDKEKYSGNCTGRIRDIFSIEQMLDSYKRLYGGEHV